MDLTRAQVMMTFDGRTILGDVTKDDGETLTVRHFNGEPWPVEPNRSDVTVLDRTAKP